MRRVFYVRDRGTLGNGPGTVISNWIKAPKIANKAKPGQFVILRANETRERIPLTMADTDPAKGLINIIYAVVGKSTALFKDPASGPGLPGRHRPLGQPTHLEKVGKVICVGGGTGVAVLYPITRGLKQAGNQVFSVIGARTKELLILEDKMKAASNELMVCTDGRLLRPPWLRHRQVEEKPGKTQGHRLGRLHRPGAMMKFCCKMTKEYGVKTLVSLNPIMVGRHRHVRLLPGERRRPDEVRLRRRPGI